MKLVYYDHILDHEREYPGYQLEQIKKFHESIKNTASMRGNELNVIPESRLQETYKDYDRIIIHLSNTKSLDPLRNSDIPVVISTQDTWNFSSIWELQRKRDCVYFLRSWGGHMEEILKGNFDALPEED